MNKLVYSIDPSQKEEEISWLKGQKIYPSYGDSYTWPEMKPSVQFCVIVNDEAATAIKLRHKLDLQGEYRQR